ncbi:hypothetical protein BJ878DRAFT_558879 [Calycina marina]|uniref:Uncharacterized protein n=1 Tax=Calycina marina TaxID=1763456 RepID=A0A9P8CDB8_9HELO|nr:hypothetical protein BJ878DRAFT_558879 [Calycina marina]
MPPPSRFADREERLATEGREKYQGTARIKLEVLHFPQNEPRELDRKNVERLKGYFKKGQCHRVGRNHIPAVIDQSQLSEVLRDSNVSVKTLLSNTDPHAMLRFPAGSQLQCLHGRHRIQAAREFLTPRESWWTVDLYLSDLKAAFDDLLDLPGLWGDMRISTLNKLISMGCKEGIKDVWSRIFRHKKQAMRMLDTATVKAVELTSPKHSKVDAEMLHGRLVNGQIFAAFNLQDRELIWGELSKIAGLITSFLSFFADINYLHARAYERHRLASSNGASIGGDQDEEKTPGQAAAWKVDEVALSNFAALAIRLGFKSDQISALSQRSADREIARAALLNARKSDHYEYTDATLESNVEQIVRLFDTATSVQVEQVCPAFVSDDPEASGVRCGFPDDKAHTRDAASLTIANLHIEVIEQGESITSFFVRRSVYFAFFGRPSGTRTGARSHPSPPRDPSFGEVESSPLQQSRPKHASNTSGGVHGGPEHEAAGQERSALEQERSTRLEHAAQDGEEQERMEIEVWKPNRQEQERQALDDANNAQDGNDSSQARAIDQRRGTFIDLQNLIADGLASTSRGPATEDMDAFVQDLVGTANATTHSDRQELHQAPDEQLQVFPAPSTVRIEFKIDERGIWRTVRSLLVDISDPSEVERVAKKYMRKGIRPFDSSGNVLVPRTCFQAATADGSNTILLVPENSIKVKNQLVVPASKIMLERELPPGNRQNKARH